MPVPTAVVDILPQLTGQLLDAYARKAELDFRRYEAERQRVQHQADLEFQRVEARLDREHEIDKIWEQAKVNLWYSAERDMQEARKAVRPFSLPPDNLREMLRGISHGGAQPLLLFAPLTDESKSALESESSPQYFRTGPRHYWSSTPWSGDAEPMEGLFSRPLHGGDLDIYLVREELGDLPVVLVNVQLQAGGRLWLTVSGWGLQEGNACIRVQFPYLTVPAVARSGESTARQEALLEVEDQVCARFAPVAAQLLDWFHLVRHGRVPRLHRTLPPGLEDQRPAVAAGSLSGFLIAERDGVLGRLDALIGAARVAVEGDLDVLAAELLGKVSALIAKEPSLINDQTAVGLASLSSAARSHQNLGLTAAAYEALENATRELLHNLPGGGL